MVMGEFAYRTKLIKTLRKRFPGCFVLVLDSRQIQGITDLLVLWNDRWFALEVKAYEGAPTQPNQGYYVAMLNGMSFAAFIYPENEEEVLREIELTFERN